MKRPTDRTKTQLPDAETVKRIRAEIAVVCGHLPRRTK